MRLALLSLVLVTGLSAQSSQFRFDPAHSGLAGERAVVPGDPAWAFRTGGKVRSTPAVRDGRAYFGSGDGWVYAVDLASGKERWRFQAGADLACSPALCGDLLVILARDGVLRGLAAADGRERWRLATGPDLPPRPGDFVGWDYWLSSPAVAGGVAFVGAGDGRVRAVDAATGQVRWSFATAQRVRSSPAVAEGRVFAGSFDGRVYALDAATGRELWRFDTGGAVQSSPAVAGGVVYVGSRSAAVFALDAATGALKWRTPHPNGSWCLGSPAVAQGLVVVGSSDEQFLHALDAATGAERWRLGTRYRVLGSPVIAGDVVLAGTEGAYCPALDLETGLMLGMAGAEGPVHTSPVPAGDLILLGSDDDHLHAFKAEPAPVRRPADPVRLRACAGRFVTARGSRFALEPAGGYLKVTVAGQAPALGLLAADGGITCPAFGLRLRAEFGAGGPARILALRPGGKEVELQRLP